MVRVKRVVEGTVLVALTSVIAVAISCGKKSSSNSPAAPNVVNTTSGGGGTTTTVTATPEVATIFTAHGLSTGVNRVIAAYANTSAGPVLKYTIDLSPFMTTAAQLTALEFYDTNTLFAYLDPGTSGEKIMKIDLKNNDTEFDIRDSFISIDPIFAQNNVVKGMVIPSSKDRVFVHRSNTNGQSNIDRFYLNLPNSLAYRLSTNVSLPGVIGSIPFAAASAAFASGQLGATNIVDQSAMNFASGNTFAPGSGVACRPSILAGTSSSGYENLLLNQREGKAPLLFRLSTNRIEALSNFQNSNYGTCDASWAVASGGTGAQNYSTLGAQLNPQVLVGTTLAVQSVLLPTGAAFNRAGTKLYVRYLNNLNANFLSASLYSYDLTGDASPDGVTIGSLSVTSGTKANIQGVQLGLPSVAGVSTALSRVLMVVEDKSTTDDATDELVLIPDNNLALVHKAKESGGVLEYEGLWARNAYTGNIISAAVRK